MRIDPYVEALSVGVSIHRGLKQVLKIGQQNTLELSSGVTNRNPLTRASSVNGLEVPAFHLPELSNPCDTL